LNPCGVASPEPARVALAELLAEVHHARSGRMPWLVQDVRLGEGVLALRTGFGDTDWTLEALHTAAASLAGPGTSLLVGITPGSTGWRRSRRRTPPRSRALICLAVSGSSPKVDTISLSVEVCSNGP
jgi:hypothetical protein